MSSNKEKSTFPSYPLSCIAHAQRLKLSVIEDFLFSDSLGRTSALSTGFSLLMVPPIFMDSDVVTIQSKTLTESCG